MYRIAGVSKRLLIKVCSWAVTRKDEIALPCGLLLTLLGRSAVSYKTLRRRNRTWRRMQSFHLAPREEKGSLVITDLLCAQRAQRHHVFIAVSAAMMQNEYSQFHCYVKMTCTMLVITSAIITHTEGTLSLITNTINNNFPQNYQQLLQNYSLL